MTAPLPPPPEMGEETTVALRPSPPEMGEGDNDLVALRPPPPGKLLLVLQQNVERICHRVRI